MTIKNDEIPKEIPIKKVDEMPKEIPKTSEKKSTEYDLRKIKSSGMYNIDMAVNEAEYIDDFVF
jgi:hypothetical protein